MKVIHYQYDSVTKICFTLCPFNQKLRVRDRIIKVATHDCVYMCKYFNKHNKKQNQVECSFKEQEKNNEN